MLVFVTFAFCENETVLVAWTKGEANPAWSEKEIGVDKDPEKCQPEKRTDLITLELFHTLQSSAFM